METKRARERAPKRLMAGKLGACAFALAIAVALPALPLAAAPGADTDLLGLDVSDIELVEAEHAPEDAVPSETAQPEGDAEQDETASVEEPLKQESAAEQQMEAASTASTDSPDGPETAEGNADEPEVTAPETAVPDASEPTGASSRQAAPSKSGSSSNTQGEGLRAQDDESGEAGTDTGESPSGAPTYAIVYTYTSNGAGELWRAIPDGRGGTKWEKIGKGDDESRLGTDPSEKTHAVITAVGVVDDEDGEDPTIVLAGQDILRVFTLVGLQPTGWVLNFANGMLDSYAAGDEISNFYYLYDGDDPEDLGIEDVPVYVSWDYKRNYEVRFFVSDTANEIIYASSNLYWCDVKNDEGDTIGSGTAKIDEGASTEDENVLEAYGKAIWKTRDGSIVFDKAGMQYYKLAKGEDVDTVDLVPYYRINFNANGGVGADASEDLALTDKATTLVDLLKAPTYTREGFELVGWSLLLDNANEADVNNEFIALAQPADGKITVNMTLDELLKNVKYDEEGNPYLNVYAVWKPIEKAPAESEDKPDGEDQPGGDEPDDGKPGRDEPSHPRGTPAPGAPDAISEFLPQTGDGVNPMALVSLAAASFAVACCAFSRAKSKTGLHARRGLSASARRSNAGGTRKAR